MYKIIRCGNGFDPVIVVSPPDAGPDTPNAKNIIVVHRGKSGIISRTYSTRSAKMWQCAILAVKRMAWVLKCLRQKISRLYNLPYITFRKKETNGAETD